MSAIAARRNGNNAPPGRGNGNSNNGFLKYLPAVETHAAIQFRHLRAADKAEAIAESVAAAFCGYSSARQRGKEHAIHPSTLAHYSVLHVKAGRHVGGPWESKTDVMSRVAQRKHGFRVFSVADVGGYAFNCMTAPDQPVWRDRLQVDRKTTPADLACFRIDWSRFLAGQTDRSRTLLAMLGSGYRSVEIADHLGITPPAISQRRKKAAREWAAFQAEGPEDGSADAESNAGKTTSPVKTGPKRVAAWYPTSEIDPGKTTARALAAAADTGTMNSRTVAATTRAPTATGRTSRNMMAILPPPPPTAAVEA